MNEQQKVRKFSWTNILIGLLIIVGVYFFVSTRYDFDLDLIWHYLMGRDIINSGVISKENFYSWIPGTEWNQQEWLFGVLFYLIVDNLGMIGFHLMYISSVIIILMIGYKKNKNRMESVWFYILMSLLVMTFVPMCAPNRPSDFSTLFLPIMLLLYDNKSRAWQWKYVLSLLIGIFLCNFHCAQGIAILAMIVVRLVLDVICNLVFGSKRTAKYYGIKIGFILSYIVGLMVRGPLLIMDMFRVLKMSSTRYIQEWQQMPLNNYVTIFILMIVLLSLGYALCHHMDERTVVEVAMISATLMLSLASAKSSILFVYMFIVYGYRYFEEMLCDSLYRVTGKNVDMLLFVPKGLAQFAVGLGIMVSILFTTGGEFNFKNQLNTWSDNKIGGNMISYLQAGQYNLLHSYDDANYLMWNGVKVMVDTRQQPYAKENGKTQTCDDVFYLMYHTQDKDEITRVLKQYDVDAVLCTKSLNLNWYMSYCSDFEIAKEDTYGNILWIRK